MISKYEEGVELHFPVLPSVVDPSVNTNTESVGSHEVTVPRKGDLGTVVLWLLRNPGNTEQKIQVNKKKRIARIPESKQGELLVFVRTW